jgi:uncharacterized membrane protein
MSSLGFIQTIVIIILVIVILSLLGVSLSGLFENKTLKDNFSYVWQGVKFVGERYLAPPARTIWNIFLNLIWSPFIHLLENLGRSLEKIKVP